MKRVPDKITMMQLREQPGEVLRAVEHDGRTITVTKSGREIAKIVPLDGVTKINSDGSWSGPRPITMGRNLGTGGYGE